MAEASQGTWAQDRNVSRKNLRHEKRLKKQLDVLEKERNWKSKSLEADKRCFEEKVHRLNMSPTDRAHLAKDTKDMVAGDKKKELDRLLKSLLHRPYETRAGYSYIEYLSRNMQPLVKRPLQWGVNPPLSPRTQFISVDACQPKTDRKPNEFLTRIEGQTVALNQRVTVPIKRKERFKPEQVVLPPISAKPKSQVTSKYSEIISETKTSSLRDEKVKEKVLKLENQTKMRKKSRQMDNKNTNTQEKVSNEPVKNLPSSSLESKEMENTETVPKEDVFVTMVRLDVPTPNYYHLEAPMIKDDVPCDEQSDGTSTPELESRSQGYYTVTIGPRDSRRKSI
ncbi:uncharacterized protein LOC116299224 [Actinia tenebrosa]|uniref:Uncharacterized protein LOC116299224 n=1 Tax=Actinia tenebrosa TaxID=6105 RepID=A0A6P8ICW3_ACTTE|nr:uncharacterized protein LOC116299224 [Actinia tenebrosa]